MAARWPALRAHALKPVRRYGRVIQWTHPGINFGNFCYRWMRAFAVKRAGGVEPVLLQDPVLPWLDVFPALRDLSIHKTSVRWTDAREFERDFSFYGVDFGPELIADFTRECLLTSDWMQDLGDPDRLTINVRRGDYYGDSVTRGRFGFDVLAYLEQAVERSVQRDGPPSSIVVVSDGLDWCRNNLNWLSSVAPLRYGSVADGAPGDFAEVATSRRIVLANSTFSYWAGYVSTVIHGGNHLSVWAPAFHRRDINDGLAWQLDPRWSVVTSLPRGWAEQGSAPDDERPPA